CDESDLRARRRQAGYHARTGCAGPFAVGRVVERRRDEPERAQSVRLREAGAGREDAVLNRRRAERLARERLQRAAHSDALPRQRVAAGELARSNPRQVVLGSIAELQQVWIVAGGTAAVRDD